MTISSETFKALNLKIDLIGLINRLSEERSELTVGSRNSVERYDQYEKAITNALIKKSEIEIQLKQIHL